MCNDNNDFKLLMPSILELCNCCTKQMATRQVAHDEDDDDDDEDDDDDDDDDDKSLAKDQSMRF